ncbi:MAG: RNA methyltransferase [Pseudomonadota bacterium]
MNSTTDAKRYGKLGSAGRRPNSGDEPLWLYGRHAVAAALANPERRAKRLVATKNAFDWLQNQEVPIEKINTREDLKPGAIDKLLPQGAVHQGIALLTNDLPRARLKDACTFGHSNPDIANVDTAGTGLSLRPVLVLDQITDPQNIGALFRSAGAFNARAVVVQDRRTPPLSGALAKAAAGAIERVPCVKAVNIARSIEALQNLGYFVCGLAGEAEPSILDLPTNAPIAIVVGAEGKGLRDLVATSCDGLFRIPISRDMESLNVSNAAAIALYEATRAATLPAP